MDESGLICMEERRRQAVQEKLLSGIDYVEVQAVHEPPQPLLLVYLFGEIPGKIELPNIRILGGRRTKNIKVLEVDNETLEEGYFSVLVDKWGDLSTYIISLVEVVEGQPTNQPLSGFDPRYSKADFNFDIVCPNDLDCKSEVVCPPAERSEPEIDYLAKDYASFRQLIFDHMELIMPEWKESHVPDLGVALVEILAYVGDRLSYYQDAVATEAYLDTSRQRISVRRHVRLVDYIMHEGCNSRAWVCLETDMDLKLKPNDFYFITGTDEALQFNDKGLKHEDLQKIPSSDYEVFETLSPWPEQLIKLHQSHNEIHFYTWGDLECCLPRGSTRATLKDKWILEKQEDQIPFEDVKQEIYKKDKLELKEPKRLLDLQVGDVLIFEEVLGAETGVPGDADPVHRHAVRLIRVEPTVDDLYDYKAENWTEEDLEAAYGKKGLPVPVLEVGWAAEDALPFPLCISAIGAAPKCDLINDISVVRGNVLLVDNGQTQTPEILISPEAREKYAECRGIGLPKEPTIESKVFRPRLQHSPLTHSAPYPEPTIVSKQQACALTELMNLVLERVNQIWIKAKDEQALSYEDREEILNIFGPDASVEAGLTPADRIAYGPQNPEDQAKSIEFLLQHEETYLSKKRRRVEVLTRRARSGYLLAEDEIQELEEMFGPRIAASIDLANFPAHIPARTALLQDPHSALPSIRLLDLKDESNYGDGRLMWTSKQDLLNSDSLDPDFVAEIDDEGRAVLRFGDGELGRAPDHGTKLKAIYRVGNGTAGNVGPETIRYIVFYNNFVGNIKRVRNPMPSQGGTNPEPIADVKLFAPGAFRKKLQRAITADDYAHLVERDFVDKVQQAAAQLCWTGSGYEVQVTVDPRGTAEADDNLLAEIEGYLHRYRRIGHDLVVKSAVHVPLKIIMMVCVKNHYLRGHVKAALLDIFSNRRLPDGRLGFFHPDNLTFGQDIHLSKLVAAAQAVPGVESVQIEKLERYFEGPNNELQESVLPIGLNEIARLDNDTNFPENGILDFNMQGGL